MIVIHMHVSETGYFGQQRLSFNSWQCEVFIYLWIILFDVLEGNVLSHFNFWVYASSLIADATWLSCSAPLSTTVHKSDALTKYFWQEEPKLSLLDSCFLLGFITEEYNSGCTWCPSLFFLTIGYKSTCVVCLP